MPSGDHTYTLRAEMDGPTKLATFPEAPDEPRLRPIMYAEDVERGPVVGEVFVYHGKGKEEMVDPNTGKVKKGNRHPVYEYIRLTKRDQSMTEEAAEQTGSFKDRLFKSADKALSADGAEASVRTAIMRGMNEIKLVTDSGRRTTYTSTIPFQPSTRAKNI